MTDVLVERYFDPPLTEADVFAMASEAKGCFGLHRVGWRCSFLATGGRQMLCWFNAADAESARIALHQTGARIERLWSGTVHEGPGDGEPNVIVERQFVQPTQLQQIQDIEDAGAWCLESRGVKFVRTFFSVDRKRMICLYQAPDADSVRQAQRQAGVPCDAVWAFDVIFPPKP